MSNDNPATNDSRTGEDTTGFLVCGHRDALAEVEDDGSVTCLACDLEIKRLSILEDKQHKAIKFVEDLLSGMKDAWGETTKSLYAARERAGVE